jgi:5-methylcytosine-specific restriction enzyme A
MVLRMKTRFEDEGWVQDELEWLMETKKKYAFWKWYDLYIGSRWWARLRKSVLDRDGYACVKCGASRVELHVDHLVYSEPGEEQLEELQTLCVYCHERKTRRVDMRARRTREKKGSVVAGEGHMFVAMRCVRG